MLKITQLISVATECVLLLLDLLLCLKEVGKREGKRKEEEVGNCWKKERPYLSLDLNGVGEALGDTYSLGVLNMLLATTLY